MRSLAPGDVGAIPSPPLCLFGRGSGEARPGPASQEEASQAPPGLEGARGSNLKASWEAAAGKLWGAGGWEPLPTKGLALLLFSSRFLFLSGPISSYPILSCPISSYPISSYPILSYPVLSCPILSYPVLSYPVIWLMEKTVYMYAYLYRYRYT